MSKLNKLILWCALVAIISFWLWASVQVWLRGSLFDIQNGDNLSIIAGLFIVELILLALGLIMFPGRRTGLYFGLIAGIMYSVLFPMSSLNLIGIFILIMIFIFVQEIVSKEMAGRIKINPGGIIRKSSAGLVIGFFILVSFAAYQSPAIESFRNIEQIPSAGAVFIKTIVEQTVGGQLEDADPRQKEAVFNQITQEIVREGNKVLEPYFGYLPPVLAFGLFLVLLGIGWVFVWLSAVLGIMVFWALKKINFFRIEEKDVKAETIVIGLTHLP